MVSDSENEEEDEDSDHGGGPTSCTWSDSYGLLLSSHLAECPFHMIKCPNGCGKEIRRKHLSKHEKVCSSFFEHCKICGEAVKPGKMAEHR